MSSPLSRVQVDHALDHLDLVDLGAGIIHQQLGELDFGIFGQPQRALVFKFHLGQTVAAGDQANALDDGAVQDGAFQALSGPAIHLDIAFDRAETNNPGMRFGKCADRSSGNNKHEDS